MQESPSTVAPPFWRQPALWINALGVVAFVCISLGLEGLDWPLHPYSRSIGIGAVMLASLGMVLAAWRMGNRASFWLVAVHLSALAILTSLVALWRTAPVGPGGIDGDAWFIGAMVTKFRHGYWSTDFVYKDLHSFYPPLYPMLVGKLGALLKLHTWEAVKMGMYLFGWLLPILTYYSWKKLVQAPVAFLIMVLVVSTLSTDLIGKPYEAMSLSLFLPWALYYLFRGANGDKIWSRREVLLGGTVGGLLFMTYYYYFFLLFLLLPLWGVYQWQQKGTFRKALEELKAGLVMLGIAALVSSPFWAPMVWDLLQHGSEPLQNRFLTPTMLTMGFKGEGHFLTILGIVSLVVLAVESRLARLILVLLIAHQGWMLLGQLGILTGKPLLHFRIFKLDYQLAYIGVALGAMEAVYRFGKGPYQKLVFMLPVALGVLYSQYTNRVLISFDEKPDYQNALASPPPPPTGIPAYRKLVSGKVILGEAYLAHYLPTFLFIAPNAHYSHPAGQFEQRMKMLLLMQELNHPDFSAWLLTHNRFDRVDMVIAHKGKISLLADNYPRREPHVSVEVLLDRGRYTGTYFEPHPEFREVTLLKPVPRELWRDFSPAEKSIAALFTDEPWGAEIAQSAGKDLRVLRALIDVHPLAHREWARGVVRSLGAGG